MAERHIIQFAPRVGKVMFLVALGVAMSRAPDFVENIRTRSALLSIVDRNYDAFDEWLTSHSPIQAECSFYLGAMSSAGRTYWRSAANRIIGLPGPDLTIFELENGLASIGNIYASDGCPSGSLLNAVGTFHRTQGQLLVELKRVS